MLAVRVTEKEERKPILYSLDFTAPCFSTPAGNSPLIILIDNLTTTKYGKPI
jgi:hypothetical protein